MNVNSQLNVSVNKFYNIQLVWADWQYSPTLSISKKFHFFDLSSVRSLSSLLKHSYSEGTVPALLLS